MKPQLTNEHAGAAPIKIVDLFEHGRDLARASRATKPDQAALESAEHFGEAVARENYREKYDPLHNQNDARREAEQDERLRDRAAAKESSSAAAADAREEENKLGTLPPAGEKPYPRWWLLALAAFVIGLTLMPTLIDRFFSSGTDESSGQFLAMMLGVAVGATLAGFIVFGHAESGDHATVSHIGFGAGILVAIAFGGIRICSAETTGEVGFGIFLSLIELGMIGLLEGQAISLRRRLHDWWPRHLAEQVAIRQRDAAQKELDRLQNVIADLQAKIDEHLKYVESRSPRFRSLEEAVAAAIKAVRDGYFAGLAENRGYLVGSSRRAQS
jgi:hypothetical protein